jgi:hypothetical protein
MHWCRHMEVKWGQLWLCCSIITRSSEEHKRDQWLGPDSAYTKGAPMMVVMTHEPGQMHSKLARLGWVLVAASLGWLTRKYNGWIWRLQALFWPNLFSLSRYAFICPCALASLNTFGSIIGHQQLSLPFSHLQPLLSIDPSRFPIDASFLYTSLCLPVPLLE